MNAAVNSAVSLATQSGTQFAVDALARFAAVGHGLTLPPVSQATPMVFVVDDDVSVRESLELLIRCEGWQPQTFASAKEFLDRPRSLGPCCLVLDYSLPDLNGLELQRRVTIECLDMPVIFITGHRDVPMTVQAMKAGALEFLTKPFSDDVLLNAIRDGLDRSRSALRRDADMQQLRERHASLSRRERQVMALVVSGLLNKQVGGELGISEITVKAHRGKVYAKDAGRFPCPPCENGNEAASPTNPSLSGVSVEAADSFQSPVLVLQIHGRGAIAFPAVKGFQPNLSFTTMSE
jgi:FixJ family two-component response regulator